MSMISMHETALAHRMADFIHIVTVKTVCFSISPKGYFRVSSRSWSGVFSGSRIRLFPVFLQRTRF